MVRVANKTGAKSVIAPTRFGLLCGLLSGHSSPTENEIADLLGHVVVQTLPQVAQAFGLSANTINQSWRQAGMPGTSGQWDLCDILAWRLARDFEAAEKKRAKPQESTEALERELLSIKRDNMLLDQQERLGELVDARTVQADVAKVMAVLREQLMSIPGQLAPMLPSELAASVIPEAEKKQRNALTAAHEALMRLIGD
jgi:hypothetical protein